MGYYTDFRIVRGSEDQIEWIKKKSGYNYWYDRDLTAKWYTWKHDLTELTETFPETEFVMTGRGEDGEVWAAHAWQGRVEVHRPELTYINKFTDTEERYGA